MSVDAGGIELTRTVETITIGSRHRTDLGDIDALAASIQESGLLQPPTITPDGVLVCGARRLAAIKQLGWKTVNVWIRSGISDRLGQLMAEQDDSALHKPLTQREAAALYRELKQVMAADAAQRQSATWFSPDRQPGPDGCATVAQPSETENGRARRQAAQTVTGRNSYTTLERINEIERLAADQTQPATVREHAQAELEGIEAGGSVTAAHQRMRTEQALTELEQISTDTSAPAGEREQARTEAAELRSDGDERAAELRARAEDALARVHHQTPKTPRPQPVSAPEPARYSLRAFLMTWRELIEWWEHYNIDEIAAALSEEDFAAFLATVEGTVAFADRLRELRQDQSTGTVRHLRAL